MKKVAIIGSGIGGLTAALILSHKGFEVDVYEQSSNVGGKAGVLRKNGFRFDSGPSLLTMPFVFNEIFNSVDDNFSDYITLHKLDILCKYFFSDGTIINAYSDLELFSKEIDLKTIDTAYSIKRYFSYTENIYKLTSDLFLFNSFYELSNLLNVESFNTLLNINKIDPFKTVHEANSIFFNDKNTIQLFDRYTTYNGSNPYLAPATLNIIPYVEFILGGFLPLKGIEEIPDVLMKLAKKKNAKFNFNSMVEKIITEDNIINGIKVNNEIKKYDIVISNADVNYTYQKLLPDLNSKKKSVYNSLEPSLSGLVFYWGINKIFPDLEIHNILFSKDYKKEFDDIFDNKTFPEDPTIYIYVSSKLNKDDAPEGNENWFVMVNAPYNSGQNWESEIKKVREVIINKINSYLNTNINEHILFEEILTPELIEKRTSSVKGSIYGISSNTKNAAFIRQSNSSKEIKGLYFCGGSAHPGGGIPLVALSGKITSELIIKDSK